MSTERTYPIPWGGMQNFNDYMYLVITRIDNLFCSFLSSSARFFASATGSNLATRLVTPLSAVGIWTHHLHLRKLSNFPIAFGRRHNFSDREACLDISFFFRYCCCFSRRRRDFFWIFSVKNTFFKGNLRFIFSSLQRDFKFSL